MAERAFEAERGEEEIAVRISVEEAKALYKLLSGMSLQDLLDRGLSREEALSVCNITHALY